MADPDVVESMVVAVAEEIVRGADPADAAHRHAALVAGAAGPVAVATLSAALHARLFGLGPLERLLADPTVDEVIVNAGTEVWVERRGVLERAEPDLPPGLAALLVERIIGPLGRRADRLAPVVDARLADGTRVHAVIPPAAPDGVCLSLRRFTARPLPLEAFCSGEVAAVLVRLVRSGANICVSGATSSGKTTMLNALAVHVPITDRIVTIEESLELRLGAPHVVRLEARPPTGDGLGEVTVRALVRAALRMRPDRLVIGEVRGAEAFDLLCALNTGHDGSLTTCHANSAADALRRIETLAGLAEGRPPLPVLRELVHAGLDAVVHLRRGPDGRRRVVEVAEVLRHAAAGLAGRVRLLADQTGVVAEPERRR